jgi:hypothetical protein
LLAQGRILAARGQASQAREAWLLARRHLEATVDAGHPARQQVEALLAAAQ